MLPKKREQFDIKDRLDKWEAKENVADGPTTLILGDSGFHIKQAAKILREGGLVAFPTETVYGLGANAFDAQAVGKVYAAKGRPSDNPMIVHIAFANDLAGLTPVVTEDMSKLAQEFWPGPLTMVVPRTSIVPDVVTGGLDTVGVRMPSNTVARVLIAEARCPVAAPSANISGRPSPTSAKHVVQDLEGRVDAIIVSEDTKFGLESTVVDMTVDPPVILRPGVITKEMLSRALGKEVGIDPALETKPTEESTLTPKAPGMKYKHYAPKAEMIVFMGDLEEARALMREKAEALEEEGKKVRVLDYDLRGGAEIAAKELFRELRESDEDGVDVILALAIPAEGVGFAVMNRMLKSAGYNIVEV